MRSALRSQAPYVVVRPIISGRVRWAVWDKGTRRALSEREDKSADQSGPERASGSLIGGDSGGTRPTGVAASRSESAASGFARPPTSAGVALKVTKGETGAALASESVLTVSPHRAKAGAA